VNGELGDSVRSADMADVAFPLRGDAMMADYAWQLWLAVSERLPWLEMETAAGIHPIAGLSGSGGSLYLGRRTRLILRLPQERTASAQALNGLKLDLGGEVTVAGAGIVRDLQPAVVLYAPFVCVDRDDEGDFLEECRRRWPDSRAQMICGKARSAARGDGRVRGYSLMLHGLGEQESIALQCSGLGEQRKLGCGIFVPHKSVAAVGA
jgi:CRISPR-associated protein Cas6